MHLPQPTTIMLKQFHRSFSQCPPGCPIQSAFNSRVVRRPRLTGCVRPHPLAHSRFDVTRGRYWSNQGRRLFGSSKTEDATPITGDEKETNSTQSTVRQVFDKEEGGWPKPMDPDDEVKPQKLYSDKPSPLDQLLVDSGTGTSKPTRTPGPTGSRMAVEPSVCAIPNRSQGGAAETVGLANMVVTFKDATVGDVRMNSTA